MDRFCDVIVEEILRCLPAKYLHRVRATARRYNLIILSPGFVSRYWESHAPYLSGVFLQSNRPWRQHSRFLTGSGGRPSATESMFAADLAFMPTVPPGRAASDREIFIVHATAGLLLCSRGKYMPVKYYVCNPVTWQWVALPDLPWPPEYMSGLLSVTNNGDGRIIRFQVVLFNHPRHWNRFGGGCLDLKVFSSVTGLWEAKHIWPPTSIDVMACGSNFLGQSGTAYWIGYNPMDRLIAYNCLHHTIQVLPLPGRVHDTKTALNRCIGEREAGVLRYAHFDCSVFQVWDLHANNINGTWWKLVHQVGVMELAERNPEATALVTKPENVECRINATSESSLFSLLGFHPTADIIYLDINHNVGAYSIEHGTITYQCPDTYFHDDVFPYVHPAHPVEIPAIKKTPLLPLKRRCHFS